MSRSAGADVNLESSVRCLGQAQRAAHVVRQHAHFRAGVDAYALISAGFWWESLAPAVAIASLVVGVNLIADGLQRAVTQ